MRVLAYPAILLGLLLSLAAPSLQAETDLLPLLKVLRDNGAITSEQYQSLSRQAAQTAKAGAGDCRPERPSARMAAARPTSEIDSPAQAGDDANAKPDAREAVVETEGGLTIESADEAFAFALGGNLWIDGAAYDEDKTALGNGLELRRGRVKLEGRLFHDWGFQAEYDFAGNAAEVKDAYLAYAGLDDLTIKLGQFKVPFSLEEQTSGSKLTFMERALPVDALSPGRKLGLGLMSGGKTWSTAAGVFANAIGDDADDDGDSGWSAATRATYAPIDRDAQLLHLGASLEYAPTNADDAVRYRTRPETHVTDQRLVDTDDLEQVTETLSWSLEGAGMVGPLSLQGEYLQVRADRRATLPRLELDGWYVSASWLLTGEQRRYDAKQGRFEGVEPQGPYGAWELALRYSHIDLNDADVRGGEEQNLTLGLNWYLAENLRFMANYIWVNADPDRYGQQDRPGVLQIRAQLDF